VRAEPSRIPLPNETYPIGNFLVAAFVNIVMNTTSVGTVTTNRCGSIKSVRSLAQLTMSPSGQKRNTYNDKMTSALPANADSDLHIGVEKAKTRDVFPYGTSFLPDFASLNPGYALSHPAPRAADG
jgi:hypothetical protein